MIDILETIERWRAEGLRIALATVVGVEQSAPRDPGAVLALNDRGDVAGSVSGGCVEAAVYEELQTALSTGRPRLVTYGISDAEAISVGLTCGGTIHVFVERLDWKNQFERLAAALHGEQPIVLATRLDDRGCGKKLVISAEDVLGEVGSPRLRDAVVAEGRALLAVGDSALRAFGADGEPIGIEAKIFIQAFAHKPQLYIFGAIDFSRAMARLGKFMGYRVTVVDARAIFATKARIPDADQIVVAWPDEFLAHAPVDHRTAIVVLTHDVKFDIPLLQIALRTRAGYIGAMGSRRTHENRLIELRAAGVSDADLGRISAPIGLDIGSRTPEETAISIAAEMIGVRYGRTGGRLRDGSLPVHTAPSHTEVALR